jgi:DNA polymerase III sliding clamp (beta) subunit (PCNA family)
MNPITLQIAELKPALTGLSKVISKRCALPVLGMVKIERTADGWVALTGTDLDSFVAVRMEQPAEGNPLTILVPLEHLQTCTKNCGKNDSIQIHPLAANNVVIKTPVGASWAETRCASVPVDEFPALPKFEGEIVPIPDAVRSSLHEAMECASQDETRMLLNGAYIDVSKKDCHCVVATDGRHLYSSNSFTLPMKTSVIVPNHRFIAWSEFSKDGEWRLKVGVNAEDKDVHHLQLSSRRWRLITRQIEGNFPNWRQVIPDSKEMLTTVEFENVESVIQAIQRMPDHDQTHHTIGLAVEQEGLLLMGKANKDDAEWFSVPIANVKISGKPMRVNTNRQQVIKALQFGLNRMEMLDCMSPLKFVNAGRQMVIMPVRMEGPEQTAATKPAALSDGNAAAETENAEIPQPPASTNAAPPESSEPTPEPVSNGAATHSPSAGTVIDEVLADIDSLKESLGENLSTLKGLGSKLKAMQRGNKANERELQSVRATLRSLQSVRI